MKLFPMSFWIVSIFVSACGSLPHEKKDAQSAPAVPAAEMTGLVITSSLYTTSTSLYYYDLKKGLISTLVGGESGDVYTAWLDQSLYVFNRANGRVSYRYWHPALGSRSVERPTPGAGSYDPAFATMSREKELFMAMNNGAKVVVADVSDNVVKTELSGVNTGNTNVAFRPQDIFINQDTAYVTHQSLDQNWQVTGPGAVFTAIKTGGVWAWKSLDGISLTVSNPVNAMPRGDSELLIVGTCYDVSKTSKCRGGIDSFNLKSLKVEHLSEWDNKSWSANGNFYTDLSDETLLACVLTKDARPALARYTIATGEMQMVKMLEGKGCGGVVVDRLSGNVFVGETTGDKKGIITLLDAKNIVVKQINVDYPVTGLTATIYGP